MKILIKKQNLHFFVVFFKKNIIFVRFIRNKI